MPIGLSEEHEALRVSAHDLLTRRCTREVLRTAIDAEHEALPSYWDDAADLGWLGLHVEENDGGSGFGLAELAVVIAELGRSVAPGPFVPTVHAAAVLALAGKQSDLLARLVDGSVVGTVAIGAEPVAAQRGVGGLGLSGVVRPVITGSLASIAVIPVVVEGEAGIQWCALETGGLSVTEIDSLDQGRRLAEIAVDGLEVPAGRVLDVPVHQVAVIGAALYLAEAAGMTGWCVDTAAQHARERVQFGRPIGTFQAVKHRCADLLVLAEQMNALAWDAARADLAAPDGQLAVAAAAAIGLDGAVRAAEDCIQVLGGIGFTWEHDAHLYLRRALSVRQLLGPTSTWRAATASLARSGVRRSLAVELPAEAEAFRTEVQEFIGSLAGLDPAQVRRRLADDGYLAPHWRRPWGRDAGALEQLVIDQEFRRAKVRRPNLSIAAWALPTIVEHGNEEQRKRFVRPTLYGELSWCQLFSEPGAGSDLASLSTRAERVDGGWSITGRKVWNTFAKQSDFGILLARSATVDGDRHAGISYFLLDMRTPGIDVRPLRELTGHAMFNEVFFDNVFVPDDCLVGEAGDGWRLARTTLVNERVSMATGGSFGTGVEGLVRGLEGRDVDAVSLDRLGFLAAEAHSLGLLDLRSTMRALGGQVKGSESSLRKLVVAEHEQRIQDFHLQLLGAEGATNAGDAAAVSYALLATRCLTIAGGTSEVQRNVIGERLLGLPRDA
jgi:3-oxochol-4-en-24-oyl-CoA dehydrogenase